MNRSIHFNCFLRILKSREFSGHLKWTFLYHGAKVGSIIAPLVIYEEEAMIPSQKIPDGLRKAEFFFFFFAFEFLDSIVVFYLNIFKQLKERVLEQRRICSFL